MEERYLLTAFDLYHDDGEEKTQNNILRNPKYVETPTRTSLSAAEMGITGITAELFILPCHSTTKEK